MESSKITMNNESHLQNLGNIVKKFKKKYDFIEAYLSIRGVIEVNSISHVKVECNSEFNNFTVKEVADLQIKLCMDLRKYMQDNKITKKLLLRDAPKRSWANEGTELVFETFIKV